MLLPARLSDTPEPLRRLDALIDLSQISADAIEQNTLNQLARGAVEEFLHEIAEFGVPKDATDITSIYKEMFPENQTDSGNSNASQMISEMIAPAQQVVGVDETKIARDAMRSAHTDIANPEGAEESAETIRTLTNAKAQNDTLTSQVIYAEKVSRDAFNSGARSDVKTEDLELDRYKTWVALQASKCKFESAEEVEAWKNRQIELIPVRSRGEMLGMLTNIFIISLAPNANGSINYQGYEGETIANGVKTSQKKLKVLLDDDISSDAISAFDVALFDQHFSVAVDSLVEVLQGYRNRGRAGSLGAAAFARKLMILCDGRVAPSKLIQLSIPIYEPKYSTDKNESSYEKNVFKDNKTYYNSQSYGDYGDYRK
jgi:hypothetical protein